MGLFDVAFMAMDVLDTADTIAREKRNAEKTARRIEEVTEVAKRITGHGDRQETVEVTVNRDEKKVSFVPALCTQCGASLTVDPSQDAAVCQYCGTAFVVSHAINKYNIAHADIHADKVEVHKKGNLEATLEYLNERKKIHNEQKRHEKEAFFGMVKKIVPIFMAVFVLGTIASFIMNVNFQKQSAAEEAALQQVVEQVETEMKEGRYDEALIKVNGLYYTAEPESETAKKWDRTRESLVEMINEAKGGQQNSTAFTVSAVS